MDALLMEPFGSPHAAALQHWGLTLASSKPLPGEYDANFHITCLAGAQYVLKVFHSSRPQPFVDLQAAVLAHLAASSPGLRTSHLHCTRAGAPFAVVRDTPSSPPRYAMVLDWLPGAPYGALRPHTTPALLRSLGGALGALAQALRGFSHPAAHRGAFKWDLAQAAWILPELEALRPALGARHLALVAQWMQRYSAVDLSVLRRSIIHGDANDFNVLAEPCSGAFAGLLDFGDMHESALVCDLAIAAAYACMEERNPLESLAALASAFHAVTPLDALELAALLPLVCARLCVSIVNSTLRARLNPSDPYIVISQRPALALLEALSAVPFEVAQVRLALACGARAPGLHAPALLAAGAGCSGSLFTAPPSACAHLDCGIGGSAPHLLASGAASALHAQQQRSPGAPYTAFFSAWGQAMLPGYSGQEAVGVELPLVQLGVHAFAPPGTCISAPLGGRLVAVAPSALVLEHAAEDPARLFYTRIGGLELSAQSPALQLGMVVNAGAVLGAMAAAPSAATGGALFSHCHLQVLLSPLGLPLASLATDFPRAVLTSHASAWLHFCPSPFSLALPPPLAHRLAFSPLPPLTTFEATRAARAALLGGNLRLSYSARPLKMLRARGAVMYDHAGTPFLDCYNNVPCVGHAHPAVLAAMTSQLQALNTNTRYLHDGVLEYAAALTARLPAPLSKVFLVNSASEANELAVRLARAYTQRKDAIVLEHAYHGNTCTAVAMSPYKFAGPGGAGKEDWVHVAPCPDTYRGPFCALPLEAQGQAYADVGARALCAPGGAAALRGGPALFIAESAPSVAGQLFFPPGFLAATYAAVRAAGGLCVADEVQTGFGRLGGAGFWGFEQAGVVPDIVVMGKPAGNGFPLGVCVTTPAIAAAFDNGMEYFSTFGGGPVAAAAGSAVLRVLEEEGLQENCERVGRAFLTGLQALAGRHPLIGDVRGQGLFLGLELVHCRSSKQPCDASPLVLRLRDKGVLAGTEGPYNNVVKLRPPLCFSLQQVHCVLAALDEALGEDALQPRPSAAWAEAAAAVVAPGAVQAPLPWWKRGWVQLAVAGAALALCAGALRSVAALARQPKIIFLLSK